MCRTGTSQGQTAQTVWLSQQFDCRPEVGMTDTEMSETAGFLMDQIAHNLSVAEAMEQTRCLTKLHQIEKALH